MGFPGEHHNNHTMSDVLSLLSLPQGKSYICSALLCFGRGFVLNARAAICAQEKK